MKDREGNGIIIEDPNPSERAFVNQNLSNHWKYNRNRRQRDLNGVFADS